jgi:two-component system, OmpR family, sensor histidine kinase VicK
VELFAEITFKIRQSLQLKEILRTTVNEVQRVLKADRVIIYQVLPDGTGKPISEAVLPAS